MKKFKAEVIKVSVEQLENATVNSPAGTHFIKVLFKATHEELYDSWQPIEVENPPLFDQVYFCNPEVAPMKKMSSLEVSKKLLKDHYNYEGGSEEIDSIVGYGVVLITEPKTGSDGVERDKVKYVNNPNRTREVCAPEVKASFASVFDK